MLLGENDDVLSFAADDYRRTFETNLFGVIEVCGAFVPGMARARYGRVVNVSSGAGQLATMSSCACLLNLEGRAQRVTRDIYWGAMLLGVGDLTAFR